MSCAAFWVLRIRASSCIVSGREVRFERSLNAVIQRIKASLQSQSDSQKVALQVHLDM